MGRYEKIKAECLSRNALFEDDEFPADFSSVCVTPYSSLHKLHPIRWARPKDICSKPKFIVDGTSRFDLDQGQLGNCWFVAAAATVACKPRLLEKVVPKEQSFNTDYAGIFRFHFWRYGHWEEVVVDDRLPVRWGQLVFSQNREQPDEFWCALMEKAYAKLHGSYEALIGGKLQDALVDLTAGLGQFISIQDHLRIDLFSLLQEFQGSSSLMGCAIKSEKEEALANGLVRGHAYSINKVTECGGERLLRLRNPWGKREWTGAWSDGAAEWSGLSASAKEECGLSTGEDGEFWMSFDDWKFNFNELQICHMTPDSPIAGQDVAKWYMVAMDSAWEQGLTAGGCWQTNPALYWANPQYHVTLRSDSGDCTCALIVSLLHKYERAERLLSRDRDLYFGYDVFKVLAGVALPPGEKYAADDLELVERMVLTHYRENCRKHTLRPGQYCIIPATKDPDQEAEFHLRVLTDTQMHATAAEEPAETPRCDSDCARGEMFDAYAKNAGELDKKGLRRIFKQVYNGYIFRGRHCQIMIKAITRGASDVINMDQFCELIASCDVRKDLFESRTEPSQRWVDARNLRRLIANADIGRIAKPVKEKLCDKFGEDGNHFSLADFLTITCLLSALKETYVAENGDVEDIPPKLEKVFVDALEAL